MQLWLNGLGQGIDLGFGSPWNAQKRDADDHTFHGEDSSRMGTRNGLTRR
jgi:hypothetical protein